MVLFPGRSGRAKIRALLDRVTNYYFLRRLFFRKLGYPLNLRSPKTKNEKIQWRKLYDRNPMHVVATDKYAMRALVLQMLDGACDDTLFPRLYQVTDDAGALDFDTLPECHVIKPTHGCGWLTIVDETNRPSQQQLRAQSARWLRQRYGFALHEWAYSTIPPRIIVEELIRHPDGRPCINLKFFVFGGRTEFAWLAHGRYSQDERMAFFHRDGRVYGAGEPQEPPEGFVRMLALAERIGAFFDYVRVDFLVAGPRFALNELTLYNASGLDARPPEGLDLYQFDRKLGDLWHLGQAQRTLPEFGPSDPTRASAG